MVPRGLVLLQEHFKLFFELFLQWLCMYLLVPYRKLVHQFIKDRYDGLTLHVMYRIALDGFSHLAKAMDNATIWKID